MIKINRAHLCLEPPHIHSIFSFCAGGEVMNGPCPLSSEDRNILYENKVIGLPRSDAV